MTSINLFKFDIVSQQNHRDALARKIASHRRISVIFSLCKKIWENADATMGIIYFNQNIIIDQFNVKIQIYK